jgi:hypothetical protein
MSPDRQRALDALRQAQKNLTFWRKNNGLLTAGVRIMWAQNDVKDALDRYWGVISREELLARHEALHEHHRGILFMDELDQAKPRVKRQIYKVALTRSLFNPHRPPKGWTIKS